MIGLKSDPLQDGISSFSLEAVCADDLSVVNAARVSFAKHKEVMDESDEKLVSWLVKNKHTSPLEHNYWRFHVKAPLYVVREWQRHRIASYNEMSGRYVEMLPEFHIPNSLRQRVGKPGGYGYKPVEEDLNSRATETIITANAEAWTAYRKMLQAEIAPEHARIVLPLNTYTQFYWSCNAHSLMHFIGLRSHQTAQEEIRVFSDQAYKALEAYMPITAKAFKDSQLGEGYEGI